MILADQHWSVVKPFTATIAILLLFRSLSLADEYDLVVYGGTSAGVMAAVQAKRMGKSVVIVCPDKHLGGLSSGGLGFSDTGNKAVISTCAKPVA